MRKKIWVPILFISAVAFSLGWMFSGCPSNLAQERHQKFIREIPLGNSK